MREFLFWAFVLAVLPGCGLSVEGLDDGWDPPAGETPTPDPGFNLIKGSLPRDGVVFCDIVKEVRCATPSDIAMGIPLTEGAVALNSGKSGGQVALDYSLEALARCAVQTGGPEAIVHYGDFPQGTPVCLNCGEVLGAGKPYADAAAVCVAACYDLFLGLPNGDGVALPVNPPTQATIDYCAVNATVSTNMTLDACIAGACDNAGTFNDDVFQDPRRVSEPVVWTDFIPVAGLGTGGVDGNDLIRTTNAPAAWNVGAVSQQLIHKWDAFVTFSAGPGWGVLVGFSEAPSGCPGQPECHDTDASDASVKFGIMLREDGLVFVSEGGVKPNGGGPDGSFGPSIAGDRFRVAVRHEGNGTVSIRYLKLPMGGCTAGVPCDVDAFHTSTAVVTYPLRVDSSLFHEGATATNVRLMRIKTK